MPQLLLWRSLIYYKESPFSTIFNTKQFIFITFTWNFAMSSKCFVVLLFLGIVVLTTPSTAGNEPKPPSEAPESFTLTTEVLAPSPEKEPPIRAHLFHHHHKSPSEAPSPKHHHHHHHHRKHSPLAAPSIYEK